MYGTIRMHQERRYPGRPNGTTLVNPDFAAFAHAHGAGGAIVTRSEDFAGVLAEALAADTPFVIDVRLDPEAITPMETLTGVREGAAGK
jgi:acetolactate synthase-1/2/3 large subunit